MMGPRTNFGTNVVQPGSVPAYAQGGAIDTDLEDNPMMRGMGARLQVDINSALGVVRDVLNYGRGLHGLGGGGNEGAIQEAQMPSTPFRETPVPQPMPKPNSFPYGPHEKPFGKRMGANAGEQTQDVAAFEPKVLPGAPFSETPRPQPMPGPLPPTSNPFGKRVSENSGQSSDDEEASETPQQEMAEGAIDTEDEEMA